jgi:chromosome segregation ATPase
MTNKRIFVCIRVLEDGEREVPTHFECVPEIYHADALAEIERLREALEGANGELTSTGEELIGAREERERLREALHSAWDALNEIRRDAAEAERRAYCSLEPETAIQPNKLQAEAMNESKNAPNEPSEQLPSGETRD